MQLVYNLSEIDPQFFYLFNLSSCECLVKRYSSNQANFPYANIRTEKN